MIDYLGLLREFHRAVFIKTGNWRSDINQKFIPDNPTAKLRIGLHEEEVDELSKALTEEDLEQVLKELCDCLYVLYGTAVTYNLPVEEAFKRVHANNMLKITTGDVNNLGKFVKAKDHPKVDLKDLISG